MAWYTNILMVVGVLAAGFALWWMEEEPMPKLILKETAEPSYDYVIVGGSAGCVVATRLSENPQIKVLLLEAGDDGTDNQLRVPFNAPGLVNGSHDWKYVTAKQERACLGLKGKICTAPRGKTLGGSGSINGMLYVRGSRHTYDEWAANGAEGWSFEDVLPYFIKSENMASKELKDSPYHGTSGLMNVSVLKETPIADYVHQAGLELNLRTGGDYNDMTNMEGIHYMQVQIAKGKRTSSTAQQYLWSVMARKNLHVVVHAHVTKILFEGKTATGVEYRGKDGVSRQVKARKEVIVSAGGIGSPKLLLLSGVGPKKHLQDLGIPLVADLSVGNKVKNTISTLVPQIAINQPISVTRDYILLASSNTRCGRQANGYFIENLIILRSEYSKKAGLKMPDLEVFIMASPFKGDIRNSFDVTDEVHQEYFAKGGQHRFTSLMALARPESNGYIRLRSRDPFDLPLVDPNYLHRSEDVERFIEGIKFMEKLISKETMQKIGAKFLDYTVPFPACRDHKVGTDDYWACLVHQGGWACEHGLGSCRMGAKDDPEAVVDPQLRVRGLNNIRVIDASIMPSPASTSANAATVMIAEKACDLISGIRSVGKINLESLKRTLLFAAYLSHPVLQENT